MVRRQVKTKGTGVRRQVTEAARHAPTALAVPPKTKAMMKARLETAGRKLQATGNAAGKVARSSMREMTVAVKASREPMAMLWRNVRLAGRHIARSAAEAWNEVAPARKEVMKLPVARPARRPAA
ncbi:MAG TPA: hypothetical protein VMK32_13340 [Burkholderiaceae bacterium]|nr:hypothetical protein [Burkholderiaceae bacterium]